MQPQPAPTSNACVTVEARLVELSRALSASAKLRQIGELVDALQRLGRADLQHTTPGLDERATLFALAERRLGPAWVQQRVPATERTGA